MKHCRFDYKPWEQRTTCCKCATPLSENPLIQELYKSKNTASWAKIQLQILAAMVENKGIPIWFVNELERISEKIFLKE